MGIEETAADLINRKAEELAMIKARETESLVARFMVETGLKASEIEIVERWESNAVVIYPRKKGSGV
jgi:hypothetical protein